ncbi:MAG: ABC transporter ATP-binding protein [Anaerolineae bacterium]|nr:ABC transporter ATP-binding protein [Anaerolineae bacterium]
MAPIIEVENLTKTYKKRTAVDSISFAIEENALFGFIGPNGAGKTTTIRILTTLLQPSEGQIRIDGHSVTAEPRQVRRLIGYMPDFFGVYTDMTVWEYLDFFSACYDIPAPDRPGLVNDLLDLVELSHRRDDYVDDLSRGMKQRLCLARTLVHDPKVLFLDEPASGLDPRARVEFRELLTELRKMGKTIFFSSHILADLDEICTEVAIIEAGQMVVHGNIAEMQQRIRHSRQLNIRVLGDTVEQAKSVLAPIKGVNEVEVESGTVGEWDIIVQFNGDRAAVSAVLKQLVLADVPVLAFNEERDTLEDVFMKLTQGIVS